MTMSISANTPESMFARTGMNPACGHGGSLGDAPDWVRGSNSDRMLAACGQ